MKKLFALLLAAVMMLGMMSFASADDIRVAMITDYGDITDQSFNQTTYEAAKAWSEANGVDFVYYKPASDSDEDRISSIEKAIDDGFNVILMPGYAFAPAIVGTVEEYSDITFIALDVSESKAITAMRTSPGSIPPTCTALCIRKNCAAIWPATLL